MKKMNLDINPKEVMTILTDFIKTYLKSSGCRHVVLGLSGGLDSAVAAVVCQKALTKKHINCLYLPEKTTSQETTRHVQLLAKQLSLIHI